MKSGKPSRIGTPDFLVSGAAHSGDKKHGSRRSLVALLMLVSLLSFSCRRPAPPPPPPPPETEAAPPPPPPPAPAISLSANPSSIEQGESTTLEWQAQNTGSVRIDPGVGNVAASGSRSVSPNSSVTYTATATGPGGMATDTVRVTVSIPPPPPAPPPVPDAPPPTVEELFRTTVQPVLFDYDQSDIRADQVGQLQTNARFLQQNVGLQFTVGGHADERGSQEYNIGLGDRRANAVRQFLIEQGVTESRINAVSYGEERPVCTQTTEPCYQRNRRAAFVLR